MQLHSILIGLIIVGFFAVGVASFYSLGSVEYNTNVDDITFNSTFNKMNELNSNIQSFDNSSNVETNTGIADILGSFFTSMYQSARTLKNSMSVMDDMTDAGLEELPVGSNAGTLKTAIGAIIIVLISVGIFLHFVTKSERT
jgi:hypothetical protein